MQELFASGQVADLIVVLLIAEAVLLLAVKRRTGYGLTPAMIACNLASGLGLVLALRGALVGWPWPWISGCLLAAMTAHLADLAVRWRR